MTAIELKAICCLLVLPRKINQGPITQISAKFVQYVWGMGIYAQNGGCCILILIISLCPHNSAHVNFKGIFLLQIQFIKTRCYRLKAVIWSKLAYGKMGHRIFAFPQLLLDGIFI